MMVHPLFVCVSDGPFPWLTHSLSFMFQIARSHDSPSHYLSMFQMARSHGWPSHCLLCMFQMARSRGGSSSSSSSFHSPSQRISSSSASSDTAGLYLKIYCLAQLFCFHSCALEVNTYLNITDVLCFDVDLGRITGTCRWGSLNIK